MQKKTRETKKLRMFFVILQIYTL